MLTELCTELLHDILEMAKRHAASLEISNDILESLTKGSVNVKVLDNIICTGSASQTVNRPLDTDALVVTGKGTVTVSLVDLLTERLIPIVRPGVMFLGKFGFGLNGRLLREWSEKQFDKKGLSLSDGAIREAASLIAYHLFIGHASAEDTANMRGTKDGVDVADLNHQKNFHSLSQWQPSVKSLDEFLHFACYGYEKHEGTSTRKLTERSDGLSRAMLSRRLLGPKAEVLRYGAIPACECTYCRVNPSEVTSQNECRGTKDGRSRFPILYQKKKFFADGSRDQQYAVRCPVPTCKKLFFYPGSGFKCPNCENTTWKTLYHDTTEFWCRDVGSMHSKWVSAAANDTVVTGSDDDGWTTDFVDTEDDYSILWDYLFDDSTILKENDRVEWSNYLDQLLSTDEKESIGRITRDGRERQQTKSGEWIDEAIGTTADFVAPEAQREQLHDRISKKHRNSIKLKMTEAANILTLRLQFRKDRDSILNAVQPELSDRVRHIVDCALHGIPIPSIDAAAKTTLESHVGESLPDSIFQVKSF